MRRRSCLSCDFSTGNFQVRALDPSNLLSFQSSQCCFMVMLCLSSFRRGLEGVNMRAVDVPRVTVAGGKHCFSLCREEMVLRASNLSKCTFPNEHLYFFALVSWKQHWTRGRETEALSASDSFCLCDPRARNVSSLGLGFCRVLVGVIVDNSCGDFQL